MEKAFQRCFLEILFCLHSFLEYRKSHTFKRDSRSVYQVLNQMLKSSVTFTTLSQISGALSVSSGAGLTRAAVLPLREAVSPSFWPLEDRGINTPPT